MSMSVGQYFQNRINQANRDCYVIAVRGIYYAYEYEMPAGGVFIRIVNTKTGKERSVSERQLPPWVRIRRNLDRAAAGVTT